MTTLKLGSLGIDVIRLKLRLDLNAIPYFDERTHKAVIAFQKFCNPYERVGTYDLPTLT